MNELDRLKDAFRSEGPVVPPPEAKQAAVAAAMRAFDEKNARARQGSNLAGRLRIAASAALELLTGKRPMRMTHALAGGASLLVLTLAVMTAANLHYLDALSSRDAMPIGGTGEVLKDLTAATEAEEAEVAESAPPAPVPQLARQDAAEEADVLAETVTAESFQDRQAVAALEASPPAAMAEARPAAGAAAPMAMQAPSLSADVLPQPGYRDQGRDRFADIDTNPLKVTTEEPVSTFSIDVDTASYSFVRAALNNGVLPQEDAVRVEELINYFPYDYPGPESRDVPFRANVSVLDTPWNPATKLVHIGIKGFEVLPAERPKTNLVFLIDTSGSMDEPNKLPLLINSLKLLVDGLDPDDTVSIVAYAGSAGTVLEPTSASDKAKIVAALENLWAGGSTAGAEGIRQAYQLAEQNFDPAGVNRVMLATDGDFNVGITDTEELKSFVERQRETGIFLSVLGFGRGNYNDELMQVLAQNGNGSAAYIDTLNEARKVLVEEAASTMFPIAKDVKIQVEFNPAAVSEYRLIGYETRMLAREDFNNDRVDAGEIGSGH
ncbi:MAG TPA: von Willebrand factor type A domain-containing protein, partial [Propylenella sp.]|nr:von Willebrand factor type A domain-containing protein [Propylenella sp.]